MYVLYVAGDWEYDFIINDLLNDIEKKVLILDNFKSYIDNYMQMGEKCIVVVGLMSKIDFFLDLEKIKPEVIFFLSDEFGNNPNITRLEKYTKLFLRQYNHSNYKYGCNSYHIPLGYAKTYLSNKMDKPTKKIKERSTNCSFVGQIKSDREHMINIFKKNMKNTNILDTSNTWVIESQVCPPPLLFDIYNNSIFVISGRGNKSLDCFRIYEAIVAGAIPVTVGSAEEIQITFNFNGSIPEIIYADDWETAVDQCNKLLCDYEKLQSMQDSLLNWWCNQKTLINTKIKNILSEAPVETP
jgi:hypothetical protein